MLTPIFNEFMSRYLKAESAGQKEASTNAIIWFGEEISKITADGFQEYMALELETNSLKLTASPNVSKLLDELKVLQHNTFEVSSEMLTKMVEITINNDTDLSKFYQHKISELGNKSKQVADLLREEMRQDLSQI